MNWQIQEAKNKLSEVIARAREEGPQAITRHGREVAVLVASESYRKLVRPKTRLSDFFRKSPLVGRIEISPRIDRGYRDVTL